MSPWSTPTVEVARKYGIPTEHEEAFDGLRQEVAGTVLFADLARRLVDGVTETSDPAAAGRLARHALEALDNVIRSTVSTLEGVERDWRIDADRLAEVMEENAALLHRQSELLDCQRGLLRRQREMEQGLAAMEDLLRLKERGQALGGQ
jgi:hypothetical protein